MSKLQHTILTNANKYIIDALCDLLNTKVKAVVYGTKTFFIELSNGNFIEACSFYDAINQLECLVN
jgi:hypothetical protein